MAPLKEECHWRWHGSLKSHRTWTSLRIGEEEKMDKTISDEVCRWNWKQTQKAVEDGAHVKPGGKGVIDCFKTF